MKFKLATFSVALVLAATAPGAALHAAPLEIYGQLPSLEDVAISPDGGKLALVRTQGENRVVTVYSIAEHKTIRSIGVGKVKLRSVVWADDYRVLLVTSGIAMPCCFYGNDSEWFHLHVFDIRSSEEFAIPDIARSPGNMHVLRVISGEPMVRNIAGHTVLFVPGVYAESRTLPCLIRYDLDTNNQRIMDNGAQDDERWLVDAKGVIAGHEEYEQESGQWRISSANGDNNLHVVASGKEAIDYPVLLGFGPSETSFLVRIVENGKRQWRLMSRADGSIRDGVPGGGEFDAILLDPATDTIMGGIRRDDDLHYTFFDPARQKKWDSIVRAYGGDRVHLSSTAANFERIIVRVEGPKMGFQYQLIDFAAHQSQSVGDVYEGLDQIFDVRRIAYPAKDGLEISAYLTFPATTSGVGLPLVVLPHGGPAAHDSADFNWWAQALASRGYAVLQPNYRGSNLNHHFLSLGYGEFGRKMQSDLSDGVRFLAEKGTIDPARVCIVGASYGGYAALAGVTLQQGIYRCAAAVAGVSDAASFLRWVDENHLGEDNIERRYWDRFLGVQGRIDPKLDEISPLKHVAAVAVPVLLIHGKDDTVVPIEQSEVFYSALRGLGKKVEFVKLDEEDHWLSRSPTRRQMLEAVIAFLERNNPPK